MTLGGAGAYLKHRESDPPYDLSSFNIPFQVIWPNKPTITRTVDVSTATQFTTEAATPGTELVIDNSFTGNVTIAANDIKITMNNAATITGTVSINPTLQRLWWRGGNVYHVDVVAPNWRSVSDHLFEDVYWTGFVTYHRELSVSYGNSRIAWVNSTIDHVTNTIGHEFAFFSYNGNANEHRHSDFIFANVRMEQSYPITHSTTRIQACDRQICVDGAFGMSRLADGSTGYRTSAGSNYAYMANTIIGGRFHLNYTGEGAGDYGYAVRNATYENVTRYTVPNANEGNFATSDANNTGTVNGCQVYSTSLGIGNPPSISPFTGTNPNVAAWGGSPLPDVSGYGAQR